MTNPNPGPAGSVTEARTVAPATSVGPATSTAPATSTGAAPTTGTVGTTATDLPYVAPSQLVGPARTTLPDDHPQVRAASAPPPAPEMYRRAPTDPKDRAAFVAEERARLKALQDRSNNS